MGKFEDLADELPTNTQTKTDESGYAAADLLKSMLLNLQTLERPSNRPLELRSSSLPFCPIYSFLLRERQDSYRMSHYTSTGTATHETLQHWLPYGEYGHHVFGSWKCSTCKTERTWQLKPKPCNCDKDAIWLYQELALSYRKLTGHVDMLLQLDFSPNPNFALVDFKSTDMVRKRSSIFWNKNAPSSRNYIVQVRTYCTILTLKHKLNVTSWLLPSIDRAKPITTATDFSILAGGEWNRRKSQRWLKYLDAANDNWIILQRLMRHLREGNGDDARYWLKEMVRERPCQTPDEYQKWMRYAFFGKEQCPMFDTCCNNSHRDVYQEIRQRLRAKR